MKKTLLIFLLLLPLYFSSFAGNENYPVGGRQAGLANAGVCLTDIWAVYHNQAALADYNHFAASVYYENRFLVKEMGMQGAAVTGPTKSGVFGLSFSRFGYSLYNESKYGLAFAKSFGENFSAGVQVDYLDTRIGEGYGNKGVFAVEAGLRARLAKKLYIGFHGYNLTRVKLADYNNERVPTILKLGLQYIFSDKVFVAIETEKDIDQKPVFMAGVEYHVLKAFYLRAGIASNPFLNTFGFGLEIADKLQLDVSTSIHPVLGVSPQASLTYVIK